LSRDSHPDCRAAIGVPSSNKTPALGAAFEACAQIERDAVPDWERAKAEHDMAVSVAKVAEEQWQKDLRDARKTGGLMPHRPPDAVAPATPARGRLKINDSTIEELQALLADNPRGLLYTRDELAGWLGNLDRYGGTGGDRAFFIEGWNGGPYTVDRVKRSGAPLFIARNSIAILGGTQPDKIKGVFNAADDGLVARFAFVWPDPAPIADLTFGSNAAALGRQAALTGAARRLHALRLDDEPRYIRLGGEARAMLNVLHKETTATARSSEGVSGGWHGKTKARAVRLALVFELLAWAAGPTGPEPKEVSTDATVRAFGYADYLSAMFTRTVDGMASDRTESDARVLAAHIRQGNLSTLEMAGLYLQPGWRWLRDKKRRSTAIAALTEAGWVTPAAGRGRLTVNPEVLR
jgi:hypothetical protein